MGINNIGILKGDDDDEVKLVEKQCANINFDHAPHNWGEKGKFYFCNGVTTAR